MLFHNVNNLFHWPGWLQIGPYQELTIGDVVCDNGLPPNFVFAANNTIPVLTLRLLSSHVGRGWIVDGLKGREAYNATASHITEASVWRRTTSLSQSEIATIRTEGLNSSYAKIVDDPLGVGAGEWKKPKGRVKMNKLYAKPHPFWSRDQESAKPEPDIYSTRAAQITTDYLLSEADMSLPW